MEKSEQSIGRKITIWFLSLCLFMCILAYAVYHSITHLLEQNRWVSHTHEVLIEINETISQLKDIQASQRGYIITGNINYLEPYDIALPLLEKSLKRLSLLVADNAGQYQRNKILNSEAKKRVEAAEEIITIYNKEGQEAAFAKIKTGFGKREMDAVRHIAAEMIKEEKLLLELRQREAFRAIVITLTVCILGLFSCFVVLMVIFNIMHKEIVKRGKMQADMEQLNRHIMLTNKLGDLLQSCQNLQEASLILKQHMSTLLPATQGAMALANNSYNQLEVILQWGEEVSQIAVDFSPDECWALRSGKAHMISEKHLNPVCSHITEPALYSLCLPMIAHGETIGTLYIASSDPNGFSEMVQTQIRTITEQAALALSNLKLQDTLRMQSIKDPLTQLFNRRYMEVTLEREISRAKRNNQSVGVIMIDLDHFKRINDTYGHDAGDLVLKEFAALLKRTVRSEDIACRYGGEEFIVILPNISKEMIYNRTEDLRVSINQLTITYGHQLLGPFTLSAGIAIYPLHGKEAETIVTIADTALYKAKKSRNSIVIANEG